VAPQGQPRKQRTVSRDDNGQGFRTKKAAEAHMHAVLATVGRGEYVEPSRMTVGQFFDAWVSGGCNGVRASTLRSYRGAAKHIKKHVGGVPLQALTRAHLRGFYGALRRDGARLNGRPGRLGERTIAKIHIAITSALNQALQDRLITSNPAAAAAGARKSSQLVAPVETRSRRPTWSSTEIQAFLAGVANDRDYALYRTGS
jgi:integrase